MTKPNIFDIGTKELHQDAFITWLLCYADPKYTTINEALNKCGRAFITLLIQKTYSDFNENIVTVEAGRQWENIDIWAIVNNEFFIIIEDKIHSSENNEQLSRYHEKAHEFCNENNNLKPVCIYLKTGNESKASLNAVEGKGFEIFSRKDFLRLLNNFEDVKNDIFLDFKERINRIERLNNEFESKKIKDWNGNDWQGFFQFLENEINLINWSYVNNPKGGFWNAGLIWMDWYMCPAYIQLEQNKLCFKVSTHPLDIDMNGVPREQARESFYRLLMETSVDQGIPHIKKPQRFGNGNYMTCAIVEQEHWLGNDDELLNKEYVLEKLKLYIDFFKSTIAKKRLQVV